MRKYFSFWLLVVPTILAFYASLFAALAIRYPQGLEGELLRQHVTSFSIIFIFWLAVYFGHNLFELEGLRSGKQLLKNIVSANLVGALVAVVYFYLQPGLILTPRRFLLLQTVLNFAFVLLWFGVVRWLALRTLVERIYIIDIVSDAHALVTACNQIGTVAVSVVSIEQLEAVPKHGAVTLVLPDSNSIPAAIVPKLYTLRSTGARFMTNYSLYERLHRRVYLAGLNEAWLLYHVSLRRRRIYDAFKRAMDIVFGIIGLLVFVITLPLIALLIVLTSRGPIFFTQERVGQFGAVFTMYKYRTMVQGNGNTWTSPRDARITAVGKVLRRLRLDELPQAINILSGAMSVVGPRPEQVGIVRELETQIPFYNERHVVKPGLTGWAQLHVYAATIEETKQKLEYDLYYIRHRSLWFDIEIMIKTMYHVVMGHGR